MAKENEAVNKEKNEEIEMNEFLDEIEDFVKYPYKYHKGEPDFKKPFTDAERKSIEKNYTTYVEMYNLVLPEKDKLELDLKGLHAKMDDLKHVEIYRRSLFLKEKETKQVDIYQKLKAELNFSANPHPLARDMSRFMRIDGSKESEYFNRRFVELYMKHPVEITHAVLKGIYKSDSTVYNAMFEGEYERSKAYLENYENVKLSYDVEFIQDEVKNEGGFVKEFQPNILKTLVQAKQDLGAKFDYPELIFEMPELTLDQAQTCMSRKAKGYEKKYANMAANQVTGSFSLQDSLEKYRPLKENKIFEDKEPLLTFKAIENKNGKETEIRLADALKKSNPNIKIVKRSEEEKDAMLYITNGIKKREIEKSEIGKNEIEKNEVEKNEVENILKTETSAKDSLTPHYEAIKKYLDFAKDAKDHNERKFDNVYDAMLGISCINNTLKFINENANTWFKNKEEILNLAESYGFKVANNEIKEFILLNDRNALENINLEFFDKVEGMIKNHDLLRFRREVKGNGANEFERANQHVLNDKINEIKQNIPANLSQDLKDEYIKALDNINAKVINKISDNFVENILDDDAKNRKRDAKSGLKEFVKPLDVSEKDKEVFVGREKEFSDSAIKYLIKKPEEYETFANINEKRPPIEFGDEVKNKIKGLVKIVDETGIFKTYASGETSVKQYGFLTFFNMQQELNDLINKDTSGFTDKEKKEYSEEVIKKSNELNDIEDKYDKVLDYIKQNFDMDNISNNQNIYSGRPAAGNVQGLLEKWDNKNARPGVILNGLAQLYGAAEIAGITIDEFLDNPEKAMDLAIEKKVNPVKAPFIIPREGNSLGKRLARASNYNNAAFTQLQNDLFGIYRATEFVCAVDSDKNKAVQNIMTESVKTRGLAETIQGGNDYLKIDLTNVKYNNLVNILMFGNETKDSIFEVCEDYYKPDFKRAFIPNHMEKYKEMMDDPKKAFKDITETIKDYIIESQLIDKEADEIQKSNPKILYQEEITAKNIALAGKLILENMLLANNKTLDDIADLDVRKDIKAYLDNPAQALVDIYKDDLGIKGNDAKYFVEKTQEEVDTYFYQKASTFDDNFTKYMKDTNPNGTENSLADIVANHRIGFFENIFNTKATKNYRNLLRALGGLYDEKSEYYGKPEKVALVAKAYLDHKYKGGKTIDNLSGEAKARAKFCENFINAYQKTSYGFEIDVLNNKKAEIKEEKKDVLKEKVTEKEQVKQEEKLVEQVEEIVEEKQQIKENNEKEKTNVVVQVSIDLDDGIDIPVENNNEDKTNQIKKDKTNELVH